MLDDATWAAAAVTTPFVTLTVSSSGERGLIGVTLDPAFTTNGYVYVTYTATTPAVHNRVSRFTASGDVALTGSEVVLLDLNNLSTATNHNGGALAFGPDGSLYVVELFTHVDLVAGQPVPSGGDVKKVSFANPGVHTSLTDNQLNFPAGVAVGSDGGVYVVNRSTFQPPGSGSVVRLKNQ